MVVVPPYVAEKRRHRPLILVPLEELSQCGRPRRRDEWGIGAVVAMFQLLRSFRRSPHSGNDAPDLKVIRGNLPVPATTGTAPVVVIAIGAAVAGPLATATAEDGSGARGAAPRTDFDGFAGDS